MSVVLTCIMPKSTVKEVDEIIDNTRAPLSNIHCIGSKRLSRMQSKCTSEMAESLFSKKLT